MFEPNFQRLDGWNNVCSMLITVHGRNVAPPFCLLEAVSQNKTPTPTPYFEETHPERGRESSGASIHNAKQPRNSFTTTPLRVLPYRYTLVIPVAR